jgi:hypothetical protein
VTADPQPHLAIVEHHWLPRRRMRHCAARVGSGELAGRKLYLWI